jgi:hypothetical protein
MLRYLLKYKYPLLMLYIIFPLFLLLSPFDILEKRAADFLIIINFYLPAAILFLYYYKKNRASKSEFNRVRSPFKFIWQKNFTHAQNPPLRPLIGAEIGVFKGDHAQVILNYLNIDKLVLVDPWLPIEDGYDIDKEGFNKIYDEVKNRFENVKEVEIVREVSVKASKGFNDNYFDFIYIDANHKHEFVLEDLETWYPKLKKYGTMCGDDFGHPSGDGVISAVTEFAFKHKVLVFSEGTQFWFVRT